MLLISFSQLDVSSPASYLIALVFPALDALLPVVPSETAIVLIGLAACGAFIGDNVNYQLGRWFGPWVTRRFLSGDRGTRQRAWAERSLDRYGARLIIACRFIPGGRTVVTLTCGLVGYQRRSFVIATAVAAVIWASYAFLIGRLGGQAFADKPWVGLLLALGIVLLVSVIVEVLRRTRPWRWLRRPSGAD